jgi:hypothetical protein
MTTVPKYSPDKRDSMVNNPAIPRHFYQGLTDDQFGSTFDSDVMQRDPYKAAVNFKQPHDRQDLRQMLADNFIAPAARKISGGYGAVRDSGTLPAAALGGAIGFGGGYLLQKLFKDQDSNSGLISRWLGPTTAGLIGAGGLAALMAAQSRSNPAIKSASTFDLITKLETAPISASEKGTLIAGLRNLDAWERQQLQRKAMGVTGAALAAVISRFLISKGLIPTAAAAIIGGMAGYHFGSSPRNAYGQYSLPTRFG